MQGLATAGFYYSPIQAERFGPDTKTLLEPLFLHGRFYHGCHLTALIFAGFANSESGIGLLNSIDS
jgi:hypothetical protein